MTNNAKPFLKWAGGKKQLLEELDKRFPAELESGEITRYIEPFVGGGAVFFHVMNKFDFEDSHICDVNEELIVAYSVVKNDVEKLIEMLDSLQSLYYDTPDQEKEIFYYEIRDELNKGRNSFNYKKYNQKWIKRAAQLVFLNRTCYNGLFRVNSKGFFNVPFGRYKNPRILDAKNLRNVSDVLQNTQIHLGDFTICESLADENSFVYLDPPYRPLSRTSSFTSYSKDSFDDGEQFRLADFYRKIDAKGARLMLSNSDPKYENPEDDFFDEMYSRFNIDRVLARRNINSKGHKRGPVREIIVTNYQSVPKNPE
ncbi:DNA adenine methylase [Methanohalophilus sp.]|uniref:DNA adenine methylase n=1 Tax=Methanohalophilus sp. TaxID=1966352 RepID=UPI0026315083|nr:DNA adenine methylase [Methanohalophilus sp.]MDK2893193.1 adenine methylase [Methanohalophilus sp.]